MTDQNQNKQKEMKGGVHPLVAAVAGAVVGAGVAAVGVVLSDKKNREKVADTVTGVKKDVVDLVKKTQKQAESQKNELQKRFSEDKEKINKAVSVAKDSVGKTTKEVNKVVKSL